MPAPQPLRLIVWPSLVTGLVNFARLFAERQGWATVQTGGAFSPLGITWLAFVFGAWFGWRNSQGGAGPRSPRAWSWSLLALLAVVGMVMWRFGGIDRTDTSASAFEALRSSVLLIAATASAAALLLFLVWPRQAWTLLLYAIPARATVVLITWFVKRQGWDTHYVKFGPAGIEVDLHDTMVSASLAQFGFWVPFTVIAGTLAGSVLAGRARAAAQ
ncbi:MAG TPA: hypothetical protein VFZ65_09115 [Planctomycetota bacterium]|nr:hypothetical protein [Planctomycetota bacterium]